MATNRKGLRVEFLNALSGAFSDAGLASRTFAVIDNGKVIFHCNSVFGTEFCTNAATDTTRFTAVHNVLSLALRGTCNVNFCRIRHEIDKVLGAGFNAQTASLAKRAVDFCNLALCNVDGVISAFFRTGSAA